MQGKNVGVVVTQTCKLFHLQTGYLMPLRLSFFCSVMGTGTHFIGWGRSEINTYTLSGEYSAGFP